MDVRTGRVTCLSNIGYDLTLLDLLTDLNMENGTMPVKCSKGIVMLNLHIVPVGVVPGRSDHNAVSRGEDRRISRRCNIGASVEFPLSRAGIMPVSVRGGYIPVLLQRPREDICWNMGTVCNQHITTGTDDLIPKIVVIRTYQFIKLFLLLITKSYSCY